MAFSLEQLKARSNFERTPTISMDVAANFKSHSGFYSSPILGPLTDSKISKYQKQGRYEAVPPVKPKTSKHSAKHLLKKELKKLLGL